MDSTQETILEIDLEALRKNYVYLRSKLQANTKFLAVVKAYAYGSAMETVALELQGLGVDYFAVAYTREGQLLRKAGIQKPILVLHPQPANFRMLIEECLEPSLYSPKILRDFLAVAKSEKLENYPVHIKFNTGLNRLGFWENDVDFIIECLGKENILKPLSIFSHLAASEDAEERDFTNGQIQVFEKIAKEVDQKIQPSPFKHLLNTSGIINYPEAQWDMVRSGIGLYGFGNDAMENAYLKPVARLKTIISQMHKIDPGETVGYNRAYTSDGYRITATLPIGHADGIGRHYGNGKAFVKVKGKKAPIIGNVCMDMIMIDVTDIDCKEGDEVILFDGEHTAETLAGYADTISYELLTSISQRIKRVVLPSQHSN